MNRDVLILVVRGKVWDFFHSLYENLLCITPFDV
jgi:hypothetical protein